MIISVDSENKFAIQNIFMIKTLKKLEIQENYLSIKNL